MCCDSHGTSGYRQQLADLLKERMERTYRAMLLARAPYQARSTITWAPAPVEAPVAPVFSPVETPATAETVEREVVTVS